MSDESVNSSLVVFIFSPVGCISRKPRTGIQLFLFPDFLLYGVVEPWSPLFPEKVICGTRLFTESLKDIQFSSTVFTFPEKM